MIFPHSGQMDPVILGRPFFSALSLIIIYITDPAIAEENIKLM